MLEPGFYRRKWTPREELVYVTEEGQALTPGEGIKQVTSGGYGSRKVIKESALEPVSEQEVNDARKRASQLVVFIDALKEKQVKNDNLM